MKRATADTGHLPPKSIQQLLPAFLLLLITLLAYVPAMRAGFIWDDDAYVTRNPVLQSAEGLVRIWTEPGASPQYYPLVFTTFWLEQRLWSLSPFGYHLVNVLLHALSALLLWRLLRFLDVPGAWMAAAVFALHPVHVESVAWVTERKNVLSALFYLASMSCLARFFFPATGRTAEKKRRWYAAGLLLFAAALLSKTVACTLPAALVLFIWWKRGRVAGREAAALAPFFALGLVMGLMTAWLEQHHVGAMGAEWTLTGLERILIAGRALWFYAAKLLWPAELIFNYPRWQVDAADWQQYLYPAAVVLAVAALWYFRKRIGRGPLTAVLFFCGTLFPALGFFDVYPFRYSYVADHFQYLASIGLIVLPVAVAVRLLERLPLWHMRIARISALAVLAVLGWLTWQQSLVYKNPPTLWQDTLEKNPASWLAHNNLGVWFERQGKLDQALEHYRKRLRLQPGHAKSHYNLGVVLTRQKKFGQAADHFQQALQIRSDYAEAHHNLGFIRSRQGKLDEAIGHYAKALQIQPEFAEAHYNLGIALARQEKLAEAVDHFQQALRIDPGYAEAHNNLGVALSQQGRRSRAIEHFIAAIRLAPDYAEARANLSLNYWLEGDKKQALQQYEIVKRLDPQLATRLQAMLTDGD